MRLRGFFVRRGEALEMFSSLPLNGLIVSELICSNARSIPEAIEQ